MHGRGFSDQIFRRRRTAKEHASKRPGGTRQGTPVQLLDPITGSPIHGYVPTGQAVHLKEFPRCGEGQAAALCNQGSSILDLETFEVNQIKLGPGIVGQPQAQT